MSSKKNSDYFNLPFDVYFDLLYGTIYEFIHKVEETPKTPEEYFGVAISLVKAQGITFSSKNSGNGSLAYLLAGKLGGVVPDWFELVGEEDFDIKSTTQHRFRISGGQFILGSTIRTPLLDGEYDYGPSEQFYSFEFEPSRIILDSDRSRVSVDVKGYRLNEDGTRIGNDPVVIFDRKAFDGFAVNTWGDDYVGKKLANLFG